MSGELIDAPAFGISDADFSQVDKAELVSALARILPSASLLHDLEDLRPYECDGMAALRQLPMVVALPETEAEVVAILKVCAARGVPVVARGAGTGLSGGAQPHRFGLVLSLARFKKIVKIDAHARRRGVAQQGVAHRVGTDGRHQVDGGAEPGQVLGDVAAHATRRHPGRAGVARGRDQGCGAASLEVHVGAAQDDDVRRRRAAPRRRAGHRAAHSGDSNDEATRG